MTISQWCELNNVNPHSYYWHIYTLRQKGIDYAETAAVKTAFVELQPPIPVSQVPTVVTIQIGESVMTIPESISDEFLQRIMNSLRS